MLETLDKKVSAIALPSSAVPIVVGLTGLICLSAAFTAVAVWPLDDQASALAILLLAAAVPMLALEVYFNRHALFQLRPIAPPNPSRVAVKLCGLVLTFG